MENYIEIAIIDRIVDLLGAGEKQWGCELLPYNFSSKKPKQTNKQTNSLLPFHVRKAVV